MIRILHKLYILLIFDWLEIVTSLSKLQIDSMILLGIQCTGLRKNHICDMAEQRLFEDMKFVYSDGCKIYTCVKNGPTEIQRLQFFETKWCIREITLEENPIHQCKKLRSSIKKILIYSSKIRDDKIV